MKPGVRLGVRLGVRERVKSPVGVWRRRGDPMRIPLTCPLPGEKLGDEYSRLRQGVKTRDKRQETAHKKRSRPSLMVRVGANP